MNRLLLRRRQLFMMSTASRRCSLLYASYSAVRCYPAAAPPPPQSQPSSSSSSSPPGTTHGISSSGKSTEASPVEASTSRASSGTDRSASDTATATATASPMRRLLVSWQQGVFASIGAVMGIGFLVFLLYAPVKEDTVHHTAVVASEALADVRLRGRAIELSKDVVDSVLRDPKSLQLVVNVVVDLLAREETKIALSSLLQSLFEDHYTQEVTKKFVLMIVRDPWIMDQIQVIAKEQVLRLLADEQVKAALSGFLTSSATESLEDPELHFKAARAVKKSVSALFSS